MLSVRLVDEDKSSEAVAFLPRLHDLELAPRRDQASQFAVDTAAYTYDEWLDTNDDALRHFAVDGRICRLVRIPVVLVSHWVLCDSTVASLLLLCTHVLGLVCLDFRQQGR